MATICCTAKLLKELRITATPPEESALLEGRLGPWYGNLLRVDRRKCLLFTDARTLYSLFVPGVKRPALNSPGQLFKAELANALAMERLPMVTIDRVLAEYQEIEFRKTVSRSVLGSMNDYAFTRAVHIQIEGRLESTDLENLHFHLNETPMSAIEMDCGRSRLLELLDEPSAGMRDPRPAVRGATPLTVQ